MNVSRSSWTGVAALVAALVTAVGLSFREIDSTDIGYHLAYGDRFLETGKPVDHNPFLYTLPAPGEAERFPPGPGCWYDAEGKYRFANANWLSQVALSLAYRLGGEAGLSVLTSGTMLVLLIVHALGLRRMAMPLEAVAVVVATLGSMLHWRLSPRPELLGYPVLSAQLYIVLGTLGRGEPPSRRAIAALALLQCLMVNLHSYFLLGIVITGALLVDPLLRSLYRTLRGQREDDGERGRLQRCVRRGSAVLVAQALASFVNPSTWRLAVLPVETLVYLRKHHVTDPVHEPRHPWSAIEEFHRLPLPWEGLPSSPAIALFHGMLAITVVGVGVSLARRRIGLALLLVAATLIGSSMRRNVPVAALIAIPTTAVVLAPALEHWLGSLGAGAGGRLRTGVAACVVLGGLALTGLAATESGSRRLGLQGHPGIGFSRLDMPLGVAKWIDEHRPEGRVWTDFDSSSNLHYFTRSRPEVNVLTNTWAYPPETMRQVLDRLATPWRPESAGLGIEVVALETSSTSMPLVAGLAANPSWALVDLEPRFVVFLRRDARNRALAASMQLDVGSFDLERWRESFPSPGAEVLYHAARTLRLVGETAGAIRLLEEYVTREPADALGWSDLGALLLRRALERIDRGDPENARVDLEAGRDACSAALARRPSLGGARDNLALAERLLGQMKAR